MQLSQALGKTIPFYTARTETETLVNWNNTSPLLYSQNGNGDV